MTWLTPQGNESPVVAGHLHGLRVWHLTARGGTFRLRSASARFDWNPGEPGAARCKKADHPAPAAGCSCGYYCFHQGQKSMMKVLLATRRPFSGVTIAGIVRIWGRTEVHPTGMRSEFATPEAFFVPDDASPAYRAVVGEMSELYDAAIWEGDPQGLLWRMKETTPGLSSACVRGLVGDAAPPERPQPRRDQEPFKLNFPKPHSEE